MLAALFGYDRLEISYVSCGTAQGTAPLGNGTCNNMAKRKLFVHIGLAKTGSTSIQHMMHELAPSLEQCGVHVVVASSDHSNHWRVVRGEIETGTQHVQNTLHADRFFRWGCVVHEVKRCSATQFVMSSEWFSRPNARKGSIRRLNSLESEADVEVEVVGYVRPQWSWAESRWCESVRSGSELRRFDDCLEEWSVSGELDYNVEFSPWRDEFARVTVRPLTSSQTPEGLLGNFLGLIGVHDERLIGAATRLPRQNPRLGAKDVEIRRMVGVALARRGVEEWQRPAVMHRLGDLTQLVRQDWPFAGLTGEQISAYSDQFAEANARFAREYGIGDKGILFHDEVSDDYGRHRPPASWDDFSVDERRAVRQHVNRTIGIDIEDAWRGGGQGLLLPPVNLLSMRTNPVGTALWPRTRGRAKSVVGHAFRLARALTQIRMSKEGFLFARWVRWEVYEFWRRGVEALCGNRRCRRRHLGVTDRLSWEDEQ